MTAVIIPYYQKEPGILRKALRSICAQSGIAGAEIIVVDDSSPVPAQSELDAQPANERFPVTLLHQSNAGPGAARNRALDSLGPASRLVAFLDSDDEWSPDHLANAERALAAGYDVYFADHLQLRQSVGAFARAGRIKPADHPAIAGASFLHAYRGDMFDQIVTGNVIGTSTVVYDRAKFSTLRFRPELRMAGEDYLFWMELAVGGARFAFSSRVEAVYGSGVNVYSASGWGTEGNLRRILNETQYQKITAREFPVTPAQARLLAAKIGELRTAFVREVIHRLSHRRGLRLADLTQQLRIDPAIALLAFPIAFRIVLLDRLRAK